MNIEQVRLCALSHDGVTEDMPFGDDIVIFRVEGKIFMGLWLGEGRRNFACKLLPERNVELRGLYAGITPAYHWNKKHWSDVAFEELPDAMVADLIRESYQLILTKLPRAVRGNYQKQDEKISN